jgi:basic membrane protein A
MKHVILSAVLALSFVSVALAAAEEQKLSVTMVTDATGLGDQGPNDAAWAGVKRAANEFGCPLNIVQSRDQADYAANLSEAAERSKIVVAVGYAIADATRQVAPKHSGVYFVQVEGNVEGLPNVVSYDFKSEEAGFLAGVVAALYTKTGRVGAVTGVNVPPVAAYETGFLAGARSAALATGRKVEPTVLSAETIDDPARGRSLAESLISKGCDVLYRVAGNTGAGVWEAAKDRPAVKIIWDEVDRDSISEGKVLASALKRVDTAVFEGIKMAVDRSWESGHKVLGYREDGVGLSEMKYSKSLFTAQDLAVIDKAKELLGGSDLVIPAKRADLEKWTPPDLKPIAK